MADVSVLSDGVNTYDIKDATARSDMVDKTSAQTITGFKTISNDGTSSGSSAQVDLIATNIDVSSAPANVQYSGVLVNDANGKRIGKFEVNQRTDGSIRTALSSSNFVGGNIVGQQLWVATATDGTAQTYAPHCNATNAIVTQAGISKSGDGYLKFGNGVIIQWGVLGSSSSTITFPTAFSSTNYRVTITASPSNASTSYYIVVGGDTLTTTKVDVGRSGNSTAHWLAIGY